VITLHIRTDAEDAKIAIYRDSTKLAETIWQAHRELSDTLLKKIEELLSAQSMSWQDIEGINCFKGPGSFTGLRIGITVANTLASSLSTPIVGSQTEEWIEQGISQISANHDDKVVMPMYGGEAHITKPRK
jgi:tRNA threonylcarbamoyladenosine biosynthesis protein TsaB